MNYFISTNSCLVRLTLKGFPQTETLLSAISESSKTIREKDIKLLFIDGSELNKPFDISEKYSIINQLDKLGLSRKTHIVVVSLSSYSERNTLETMGYNRGWKITTFKKLQIAKDWIDTFMDINSNPTEKEAI